MRTPEYAQARATFHVWVMVICAVCMVIALIGFFPEASTGEAVVAHFFMFAAFVHAMAVTVWCRVRDRLREAA